MKVTPKHNERVAKISFALIYPMYVAKLERKGKTKEELDIVIKWLTGFSTKKVENLIKENATLETFFNEAKLNPNAHLITGVICGYRIEEIDNPLTKKVRYLDKLVDELAKGESIRQNFKKINK